VPVVWRNGTGRRANLKHGRRQYLTERPALARYAEQFWECAMKFRVIEGRCSGHARCATFAPEVFVLNSDGYLEMAETEIPGEYEAAAMRGARACPEQAIEIISE